MKKIMVLTSLFVVAISIGVYVWLGGFRKVPIEEVQHPLRVVWGTPYLGKYGDLKLREIFVKTQQQLTEGNVKGTLVVLNYDSLFDTQAVDQLIGVIPEASAGPMPLNRTVDTLAAGKYIRVHVSGRPAVWPTPPQIHQKVHDYATQRELKLGKKVVEHYFGQDSMWVEYWVVGE